MSLGWAETGTGSVHDGGMKTIMKLEDLTTINQLTDFLSGTQAVAFSVISNWMPATAGFKENWSDFAI